MSRLRATDSADLILETLEVRSIRLSSNPDLAEYAAHCDATIAQDVELVLQALESHPLGEPFRAQHAGPVRAHLDALVEAENQRKALYLAEAAAHIALRATLDQAIAFHNGLQTQLMVIFKDDEDEVNAYLA